MFGSKPEHDQLDPAEALMREVGAQLREVRRERGQEIAEVAEYLRIKATYLESIERGDLSAMPGRTYALGFLRSYADYLGFDGEDLVAQIRRTVENLTGRPRLHLRAPLAESRLPKTPVVMFSLAVLAGIYAGWTYMTHDSDLVMETVAEVPEEIRRMAMDAAPAIGPETALSETSQAAAARDGPAQTDARTSAAAAHVAGTVTQPGEAPARTAALDPDVADPSGTGRVLPQAGPGTALDYGPAARTTPPAPAAAQPDRTDRTAAAVVARLTGDAGSEAGDVAGPEVHESDNADARVILRANQDSWLQITSERGDYLRAQILEAGDLFLVPNRSDLRLWTGNAGGLEVFVDGRQLPPLGAAGAVVRDVSLDAEQLSSR